MEWLNLVAAVASSIAAVLAWAAKLWWGKEFAAAKDEIIRSKDAQIENLTREIESLRQMTPMKIREYFLSVKEQLEEYNEKLQAQLRDAREEIASKSKEIAGLSSQGATAAAKIQTLEAERAKISQAAATLESQIAQLKAKYEARDTIVFQMPRIDPLVFDQVTSSSAALAKMLSTAQYTKIDELYKSLRLSMVSETLYEGILKSLTTPSSGGAPGRHVEPPTHSASSARPPDSDPKPGGEGDEGAA